MEGIYYWSILQVLLLTAGEIINVGAGMIIRNNLSYFTFTFPFKEWIAISVVTLILCICIPQIMYIESTLENRTTNLPILRGRDESRVWRQLA